MTESWLIIASVDAVLSGMKEKKVPLLGDPASLLQAVTRPPGCTRGRLSSASPRAHAASVKAAEHHGVQNPPG